MILKKKIDIIQKFRYINTIIILINYKEQILYIHNDKNLLYIIINVLIQLPCNEMLELLQLLCIFLNGFSFENFKEEMQRRDTRIRKSNSKYIEKESKQTKYKYTKDKKNILHEGNYIDRNDIWKKYIKKKRLYMESKYEERV